MISIAGRAKATVFGGTPVCAASRRRDGTLVDGESLFIDNDHRFTKPTVPERNPPLLLGAGLKMTQGNPRWAGSVRRPP